jgi:hypothetical protein
VVRDIQTKLVGLRVANVYDLTTKTYLLKLAKPDSKVFLVLESGVRIHSTGFSRETKDVPSVFTLKVRFLSIALEVQTFFLLSFNHTRTTTYNVLSIHHM